MSVVYDDEGVYSHQILHKRNPDLVLMDTKILSRAPPRFLASGIADAASTYLEAVPAISADAVTMAGGRSTFAVRAIIKQCDELLFKYGELALQANELGVVTSAFEAIAEANTLLSGLGFENGGCGVAHSVHNGFTALRGKIHDLMHGEKVAFGCIVQLLIDNRPQKDVQRYLKLFMRLGLPTTFHDMYLQDATKDDLHAVAERAIVPGESLHNMSYVVSAEMLVDAMRSADGLATTTKRDLNITKPVWCQLSP